MQDVMCLQHRYKRRGFRFWQQALQRGAECHGKTELDAAGFIRADENDKRAPA